MFNELRITARFPSKTCKERLPGTVIFKEEQFSFWQVLLGIIMVMEKETHVRYLQLYVIESKKMKIVFPGL